MRTLAAALTLAQQAATRSPYMRLHFDNRGGTTYTYTTGDATNRIVYANQWEEPYAGMAIIRLKNHDNTFSTLDLRGYSVSIGWGFVLNSTPDSTWYSNAATMKVIMQRDTSYQGEAVTEFHCVAVWAELEVSKVLAAGVKVAGTGTNVGAFTLGETITSSPNSYTGKLAGIGNDGTDDYIIVVRTATAVADWNGETSVAGASGSITLGSAVTNYGPLVYASGDTSTEARIEAITGYTVDVDEDDPDNSMADTPFLAVPAGTSVRQVVRQMLLRTKCGMRFENDGHFHVLYLDTTDATQYYFDEDHAFFANLRERAIIMPNTVVFVDALPDTDGNAATYIGTANDATSVTAIGTFTDIQVDPDLASNAEAATRAAAWVAHAVSEAYQGQILAPMECGLEVYDMVQASDARINLIAKGRIGRLERTYEPWRDVYDIALTLGSLYSYPGAMDTGPSSRDSDLKDLVISLDKKPPKVKQSVFPWQLGPQLLPATADIAFTATDNDDVTWGSGTLTFADRSTQSIDAGSLNLANTNVYYLYATVGSATLGNTQTFGNAVGNDKILVAFLKKAPETNQKAMIVPIRGSTSPLLNEDNISANSITANEIYVSTLSAITANMGLLTAGEVRVGTGTLGSNFTGWRLWVDSSVGRMAGYNDDTIQWYSDTDGKLYAGAGSVLIDASGISIDDENINLYSGGMVTKVLSLGYYDTGSIVRISTWNDAQLGIYSADSLIVQAGVLDDGLHDLSLYGGRNIALDAGDGLTITCDVDMVVTAGDDLDLIGDEITLESGGSPAAAEENGITISAYAELELQSDTSYIYLIDGAITDDLDAEAITRDIGSVTQYDEIYCDHINTTGGIYDHLNDIELIKQVRSHPDDHTKLDMESLPDILRFDRNIYMAKVVSKLDANDNKRRQRLSNAVLALDSKIRLASDSGHRAGLLFRHKARIEADLASIGQDRGEMLARWEARYQEVSKHFVPLDKMVSLSIGTLKQVIERLEQAEQRMARLEGG